MAWGPEWKTEAFTLYLSQMGPAQIAAELKRRHPDAPETPTTKTIEKWAYEGGESWSEKRYKAEKAAMDAATTGFVEMRTKLVAGTMKIQQRLQERVERAMDNSENAEPENITQEVYALLNATKSLDKMLANSLAEDARKKDAIDCLLMACANIVPGWPDLQSKIQHEFQRLLGEKTAK